MSWPYQVDDNSPIITNKPFPSGSWNTNQAVRNGRILRDLLNNMILWPSIVMDPDSMLHSQVQNIGDAAPTGQNLFSVGAFPWLFNGSGWDRQRNSAALYSNSSDATTSNFGSGSIRSYNLARSVIAFNVSSFTGTSWTPEIDYIDSNGSQQVYWKKNTALTAAAEVVVVLGGNATFSAIGSTAGYLGFSQVEAATGNQTFVIPAPLLANIVLVVTKTAATVYTAKYTVDASV